MATPSAPVSGDGAEDPPPVDDPQEGDDLARRLRESRRAVGLTQAQVAKKLGVSRRAVSEWETGVRAPHVALPGLAALYDVSTTFLLYGVEPTDATLAALRADVIVLVDEVQLLAADVKSVRTDLVALVEKVEEAFGSIRLLLVGDELQPLPQVRDDARQDEPEHG